MNIFWPCQYFIINFSFYLTVFHKLQLSEHVTIQILSILPVVLFLSYMFSYINIKKKFYICFTAIRTLKHKVYHLNSAEFRTSNLHFKTNIKTLFIKICIMLVSHAAFLTIINLRYQDTVVIQAASPVSLNRTD